MNFGSKNILIVDDDEGIRLMIKRLLLLENKYVIETAVDGRDALDKLKVFNADLIILDLFTPGKDGFHTCLDIRNNHNLKNVKIIGISGDTGKMGSMFIEKFGADEFMEKPFSVAEFKNMVLRLLKDK